MGVKQSVRHNEQGAAAFGRGANRAVQLVGVLGCHRLEGHSHRAGAEFGIFEAPGMAWVLWIRKASYLRRLWKSFFDKFQARAKKVGGYSRHAGNISPRKHKAFNKSGLDEIPCAGHNDWNCRGSVLGSNSHAGATDHDDINILLD